MTALQNRFSPVTSFQAKELNTLLLSKGLKVTPHRLAVLNCFASDNLGRTHQELQQLIGQEMDRVSLYRILSKFTVKDLLFRLSDAHGACYYILNILQPGSGICYTLVKCQRCQKVSTLPSPPQAYIRQLQKHHIQPYLLFNGLCVQCSHD